MTGPWKHFATAIGGMPVVILHQVGRLRDVTMPPHGGNVEYIEGKDFPDRQSAEAYAAQLNEKEEQICTPQ